jgi:HEPN domain-containing protein
MQPDPVRAADTQAWLEKAAMDLRSAEADLGVTPPIVGDALFHCQQAIEKALKAFLTWHDEPFRKTHDLGELGTQCVALDDTLTALLRRAAPLTEYAWKYRYPGDVDAPSSDTALESVALARTVCQEVSSRTKADVPGDG